MWTYMMAASRGERSSMMAASRRRNESESPKYGYNVGRSMQYRSTARHNVLPLHSTTSTTHPPSTYAYASSSTTAPYYESHHRSSINASDISTNLPSASTSAASTASPPPFHTHAAAAASALHRLPSYNSYHNNQTNHHNQQHNHHITHATASIDEDGTSLFSPLSPCTPLTAAVDKDTHIFVYKGAKAKTTRKRLIANHVGEMMREEDVGGAAAHRMSMDDSELEDDCDPVGLANVAAKRGRRYYRGAKARDAVTGSEMAASTCASGGGGGGGGGASGRRENDDPGVGSSGPDDDSVEEDYLELESGKRMSQVGFVYIIQLLL